MQQNSKETGVGKRKLVSTSKGDVEFGVQGDEDGYPVIAVHGGPGTCRQGLVVGSGLSESGFRVIAPTRPGYPDTPIESGRTPEEQADLIAALAEQLDIDDCVVMGISAGGPSSIQMALRHSSLVSGLLMVSTITESYDERFLDTGNPILNRILMTKPALYLRNKAMNLGIRKKPKKSDRRSTLRPIHNDRSTDQQTRRLHNE